MNQHLYQCLLCGARLAATELTTHKAEHEGTMGYGVMWPPVCDLLPALDNRVPTHCSRFLAQELGVRAVFVRDEGMNPSGSMKDYSVERAITLGVAAGKSVFFITSSGNHAFSLCMLARRSHCRAVVFAPDSSSKIPWLASFPDVLVVAVKGATFEEVYNLVTLSEFDLVPGLYSANVSNEQLLPAFSPIAHDILALEPRPTHVLSGAGNGSYLAGIAYGLDALDAHPMPNIIAVGMKGAFPTEEAYRRAEYLHKYDGFLAPAGEIDAAEGSIATESYSMPQLMYALQLSGGFTLGSLTNHDLVAAYRLLARDHEAVARGLIPEPTGIMALAAALKWRACFRPSDVLHLSFTGQGIKDPNGMKQLLNFDAVPLLAAAARQRPDLMLDQYQPHPDASIIVVEKDIEPATLRAVVSEHCGRRR